MYRINRLAIYLTIGISLTINQALLFRAPFKNLFPDFLTICVVFFGLFYNVRLGVEVGIVCGLMKDILGVGVFGANTLALGALGFISGVLSDKVYREHFLTQFIIVYIALLLTSGFHIEHAMYTALISPVIFFLLQHIFKMRESF